MKIYVVLQLKLAEPKADVIAETVAKGHAMKFSYKFSGLLGSVYGGGDLLFSPGENIVKGKFETFLLCRWKHCHISSGQQDINV